MKKLFIIPLLSFTISLFSSCSTTYSLYSTPLNNVQRVIYSNNSSPLTSTINYSNIEDKYGYEDEIVKFAFVYTESTILFNLYNKSKQIAKVDWNEIVYVDPNNRSCRVIHEGVKYIDKDKYQMPTYISSQSKLTDRLLPINQIFWLDPGFSGIWMFSGKSGGWNIEPIFPKYKTQKEADVSPLIKCSVRLIFPVYINNIKHEYMFEFKIDKIVVSKK